MVALGAILTAYLNWATSMQKQKKSVGVKSSVREIMNEIANAIENDHSFYNTARYNSRLNCYVTGAACTPGQVGLINIYLAGNSGGSSELFSGASSSSGFTIDGVPCNSFDATTGNDQCPIRFEISAQISCPGSCTPAVSANNPVAVDPPLNITISLKFNPQNKAQFPSLNEQQIYTVSFERGKNKRLTQNYCESIGGKYNAANRFCVLNAAGNCPDGTYMTGLDGSGGIICAGKQYVNVACAPGAAFVGTLNDGKLLCGKY